MPTPAKQAIVAVIVEQLKNELAAIMKSAEAAYSGAKHEDAIAKSKYDTHGLELSYLAGAQFERANLLRSLIVQYQELQLKYFREGDPIGVSALAELENDEGILWFFIGISGASVKVEVDGVTIQIITPQSPLGRELLGRHPGDEITIHVGGRQQSWGILATH